MTAQETQMLRGGALLMALDAEIAAHEASLDQLRAMREAATALPTAVVVELSASRAPLVEEPKAKAAAKALEPPPPPAAGSEPAAAPDGLPGNPRKRAARNRNRQAVLDTLKQGECAQNDLAIRSGVPKGSIKVLIKRLTEAGEVVVRYEGRRCLISLPGSDAPEVESAPMPSMPARASVPTDDPARAKRVASAAAARAGFSTAVRALLDERGPLTLEEIFEALENPPPKGAMLGNLQRATGVQNSLRERNGRALWERIPLPSEREDVTIRHEAAGFDPTLSSRIVNLIAEQPMTIGDLAVELGGSHTAIATQVSRLEQTGDLARGPDGIYRLAKREEAQAA